MHSTICWWTLDFQSHGSYYWWWKQYHLWFGQFIAIKCNKKRIIIPFHMQSIITQTAQVLRGILAMRMLEHHSNTDPERIKDKTAVDGSLRQKIGIIRSLLLPMSNYSNRCFQNRPSSCRKNYIISAQCFDSRWSPDTSIAISAAYWIVWKHISAFCYPSLFTTMVCFRL